ncbi:MAG: hypothetical protein RLZ51_1885 [Pseudomonadota bacterium]|jgi:hypothetical protein
MRGVIPKSVLSEIEQSGLPWRLEIGGRHYKLIVADRLAGILPYSGKAQRQESDQRATLNMRAQVRRIIREVKG